MTERRHVHGLSSHPMTTLGIIGAGRIGSQVGRLAVAHGYGVVISNSRDPETLAGLVKELGPKARAATPLDAARAGEIVVATIPLRSYKSVPVEPLVGKIVIDTCNYYPQPGPLREGWRVQRDTPGYGPRRNAEELKRDLATAKRYRDMSR